MKKESITGIIDICIDALQKIKNKIQEDDSNQYISIQKVTSNIVPSEKESELASKKLLTILEASKYYGIGQHKLRELTNDDNCQFVIYVGNKRMIKKEQFEKFIMSQWSI